MDLDAQSKDAFIQFLDDPSKEVEISVTESVMRGSGFSEYVAYIIKLTRPVNITVERRYRQFDALRQAMLIRWPGVFVPIIPPKHSTGNSSLKVVTERLKYLNYFLNEIGKVPYLFMSEEFQLFINSNSSDLKKMYEKMKKPTYEYIAQRYQKTFPEITPDPNFRGELMQKVNDIIIPFYNELKATQNTLVHVKKDIYRLSVKREEYLRSIGDLYSDALPQFEKYISSTCEEATTILLKNEMCQEKIREAKVSRAISYWIIYEAIRLEVIETRSTMEIIHYRQILEREQERIVKKIASNQEQLMNIQNKKTSLKIFFNSNTEQLTRELEEDLAFQKVELQNVRVAIMYMYELIIRHLIPEFKAKRVRVWRRAYQNYIADEKELNIILGQFFRVIWSM